MAAAKTGALLAASAAIGGLLAGAPPPTVDGAAHVRRGVRARLPARRRRAGHLGRPGRHRQAGPLRPAGAQEVAAGRLRATARRIADPAFADWLGGAGEADPSGVAAHRRAAERGRRARLGARRGPAPHGRWPSRRCARSTSIPARGPSSSRSPGSSWTGTHDPDRAGPHRRPPQGHARGGAGARGRPPARPSRTRRLVEGRARRPTSRWTPRTCCCASSSASARRRRPTRPPAGSARSSAPTAPGPTFHGGPATCRPRSRRTSRCGSPATRRTRRTCAAARGFIRASGGLEAHPGVHPDLAGAVRRCGPGTTLPALPPEMIFLPTLVPAQRLRLRAAGRARPSCR